MNLTCETCRFWRAVIQSNDGLGECRRYAPRSRRVSEPKGQVSWTITKSADWCGEHQPQPVAQKDSDVACWKRLSRTCCACGLVLGDGAALLEHIYVCSAMEAELQRRKEAAP